MKLTNYLVAKIGSDKLLHHSIGAVICSVIAIFLTQIGLYWFWSWLIGLVIVTGISYLKERFLDDVPDWMDLVWADCGCSYPLLAYLLGMLL